MLYLPNGISISIVVIILIQTLNVEITKWSSLLMYVVSSLVVFHLTSKL